jgi:hypothetical protein
VKPETFNGFETVPRSSSFKSADSKRLSRGSPRSAALSATPMILAQFLKWLGIVESDDSFRYLNFNLDETASLVRCGTIGDSVMADQMPSTRW